MRILLIEDNERLAEFIATGLKAAGFVTDVFGTVGDGEAAFDSVSYHAVILDLGLPDGDGLDLLKLFRLRGATCP
ncbi:MAG: response regulator transcription factor, partial [Magnetospirillum sp.]